MSVMVIQIGLGKVVSNWGVHNGVPAVFIEPVLGNPGTVGEDIGENEPQITKDSVSDGGIILEFHSEEGADVIIEDIQSAITQ